MSTDCPARSWRGRICSGNETLLDCWTLARQAGHSGSSAWGDWLEGELQGWQNSGVNTLLSLLTSGEEQDLDLTAESRVAKREGLKFLSLPIPDRQVPSSPSEVAPVLDGLDAELASGKNAVIHCRQGVGRSGMMAACLLVMRGKDPASAVGELERARGTTVPETDEQRQWIDLYAASLTHVK